MSIFQHQHLNTTQNTGNILQGYKAKANKQKTISIGQDQSTINNFGNVERVQKDVQDVDNDKKYVDQGVNANVDQERTCIYSLFNLSRKAKIIIILIISTLTILSIGLIIGISIELKPKIRSVNTSKLVRLGNGTLKITSAQLEYHGYKSQLQKIPVHKTEYVQQISRRMLQSNQPSKFYCSACLKDEGIIIRLCQNGTVAINVDRQQFTNYLNAQNSRLLSQQADSSSTEDWINIENELYRTLNSAFQPNNDPSQFHTQTFIPFTYSQKQNKFIPQQPLNQTRLLLQNRILFKVKKNTKISALVTNKIDPIVNVLKSSLSLLKSVQAPAIDHVGADLLKKSKAGDKGIEGIVQNCFVKDQNSFVCNSNNVEMDGAEGKTAIVIEFEQK